MFRKKKKCIIAYKVDFNKTPFSSYEDFSKMGHAETLLKGNVISGYGLFTPKMLKKMKIDPRSSECKDAFVKVAIFPDEYVKSVRQGVGLVEKNLFSTRKPILLEKGYVTNNSNALKYFSNSGKALTKKQLKKIKRSIKTNRIINEDLVKLEVIVYAIQEFDLSLIDFDSNDNLILTEKAKKLYIDERHIVPLTLQERMRKSLSASYQLFKGYAQCNADRFKYFVTLTFAEQEEKEKHLKLNADRRDCDIDLKFKYVVDPQDYDECVKVMTSFLNKTKKYFQRKNYEFYYLGVPEYQGNGNIHYHFLMSEIPNEYLYAVPDWLDRDYNTNKKLRGTGCTLWEYGKSDVSLIDYKNKVSTYISKYMLKSLSNISSSQYLFRLNKKRFYRSNNLDKPIIKYDYFNENDIEFVSYYFNENLDAFDGTMIRTRTYQLRDI